MSDTNNTMAMQETNEGSAPAATREGEDKGNGFPYRVSTAVRIISSMTRSNHEAGARAFHCWQEGYEVGRAVAKAFGELKPRTSDSATQSVAERARA